MSDQSSPRYATLDYRPVRLTSQEAWQFRDGGWFELNVAVAVNEATILGEAEFNRLYPDLPSLPANAFQTFGNREVVCGTPRNPRQRSARKNGREPGTLFKIATSAALSRRSSASSAGAGHNSPSISRWPSAITPGPAARKAPGGDHFMMVRHRAPSEVNSPAFPPTPPTPFGKTSTAARVCTV